MDLTKTAPRSPKDKLSGLVSLKRVIDKAKAHNAGTLGEYDYNCPHDKPLFEFLGTNGDEFAKKTAELQTDERISAWVQTLLEKKSPQEIERFNHDRLQWHAAPGEHSYEYFVNLRDQVAPGRTDVVTWFDVLDLDEKRPVPQPTKLDQPAHA